MKRFNHAIGILFFFMGFLAFAQVGNISDSARRVWIDRQIRETLQEKYYSRHGNAQRFNDHAGTQGQPDGTEKLVSEHTEAESEIHAVINPYDSSNIVIAPIRNYGDKIEMPLYVSKDFGYSWQTSKFLPKLEGGGDPMMAFDADGNLYYSYLDFRYDPNTNKIESAIVYAKSNDGGTTWSETDYVDFGVYEPGVTYKLVDKQWMAIDRSESPRRNVIYVAYLLIEVTQTNTTNGIVLKRKLPDEFWFDTYPITIADERFTQSQFAGVCVDADGRVHVMWWGVGNGADGIWHRMSEDGQNFGDVTKVSDVRLPDMDNSQPKPEIVPQRIGVMPQMEVDNHPSSPYKNNVYIVWNCNDIRATGMPSYSLPIYTYFSRSTDHGETWSEPIRISDAADTLSNQVHPTLAVSPRGAIAVSWYDNRKDNRRFEHHYCMAVSHDGGVTFSSNLQLTSVASDISSQGDFGIGDYDRAVASGFYAIPVWSDCRTNDANMNIYTAFVPFNSLTSAERIQPVAASFRLQNTSPNPANEHTTVSFELTQPGKLLLTLHDISGKHLATFMDGRYYPGQYSEAFSTSAFPAGTYILRLSVDGVYATTRLILTR